MMKTVFVSSGVVVGHTTIASPGATVASTIPGAVAYQVDDASPVDSGWTVTLDANGVPTFSAPAARFAPLTPMAFYLAFTPAERIAIKKSTDPVVEEFWATYQLAAQTNTPIDPNLTSVVEGLTYLATATTATPPGAGILASTARIAQIQVGAPQ